MAGLKPASCRFESCPSHHMPEWLELVDTLVLETSAFGRGGSSPSSGTIFIDAVAPMVEQRTPNPLVVGSNPTRVAITEGLAEWTKATVLKTVGCNSFTGSNPVPSAIRSGSIAANAPLCRRGERGFESRPDRHYLMERWQSGLSRLFAKQVGVTAPWVQIPPSPP